DRRVGHVQRVAGVVDRPVHDVAHVGAAGQPLVDLRVRTADDLYRESRRGDRVAGRHRGHRGAETGELALSDRRRCPDMQPALVVVLAMTAWMAWRGRPYVALSSTAAATMLAVDAWFDVMTTPRGHGLFLSWLLAVLVELPLAGICLWIALHAEMVIENRVVL